MFSCLTAGLGHPLIHLGYAYELNSREVAMEALGLAATNYDGRLAKLLESGAPVDKSANPLAYSTSNLFEIFARVNGDSRLDGKFEHGSDNLSKLLEDKVLTSILMEHWSAWKIHRPNQGLRAEPGPRNSIVDRQRSECGWQRLRFLPCAPPDNEPRCEDLDPLLRREVSCHACERVVAHHASDLHCAGTTAH